MTLAQWIAGALALALPLALGVFLIVRAKSLRGHAGLWLAALVTGGALAAVAVFAERWVQQWTHAGTAPTERGAGAVTLLFGFLVVAPLEEALLVAAVAPYWRVRRLRLRAGLAQRLELIEGVSFAAAASLGFAVAKAAARLPTAATGWIEVARAGLAPPSHVLLSALWGYVLGRNARRGIGGRRFSLAWLVSVLFSAVTDHLLFERGPSGAFAVTPLLVCMLLVAFVLWRDARGARPTSGRAMSLLTSAPAPSLAAIRDAFRRQDRPITLRWIAYGALVTTGMITAGVAAAVLIGHKIGIDFSAVDRPASGSEAVGPLALLAAGALVAFPASGYLLARASGTHSVLEPAMSSALAMVLVMVFMGMAAPLSVVFAIAFAPIAFGLSCAGAWVGLGS